MFMFITGGSISFLEATQRQRLHFVKMVLYLIRMIYMGESLMLDAPAAAKKFLDSMLETDKQHLLNALLGLDTTHSINCNTSFYSYRNLKKYCIQDNLKPCSLYIFPISLRMS